MEIRFEETESLDDVKDVLDKAEVDNRRYSRIQFEKYFGCSGVKWLALYAGEKPVALLTCQSGCHGIDGCYICEIQAFKSGCGYGKMLLKEIVKRHDRIWLIADWTSSLDLVEWYRGTDCLEETVKTSMDGREMHVFFKGIKECEISLSK